MIHLRRLEEIDIDGILEWMNDPDIQKCFRFGKNKRSRESVLEFILSSQQTVKLISNSKEELQGKSLHFASTNESNTYLGTVSLKNIDFYSGNSEYAISMRACTHGTGAALETTKQILKIAFCDLGLNKVYLNVLEENIRAVRFYQKAGFVFEGKARNHVLVENDYKTLLWFSILSDEFGRRQEERSE